MRFSVAAGVALALWSFGAVAAAQVAVVREPVYALDGRAIVGANRVIARTHFFRRGTSSMPHELAIAAARHDAALRDRPSHRIASFEHFLHERLNRFLREAPSAGISLDDVGDARAAFVQVAFKIARDQATAAPKRVLGSPELWGQGAVAGFAHASASLARLTFALQLKFIMGSNRRFAVLSDAQKQRLYDFYAIAAELLADGAQAAARSHDPKEASYVRRQARIQLKADLGYDPDRVQFTSGGIDVH